VVVAGDEKSFVDPFLVNGEGRKKKLTRRKKNEKK
tara:strand:+ start:182 stop:286 length:105 start_codon:yes stop_codon:yes gene_type:complete